jgi:hypothetical protein
MTRSSITGDPLHVRKNVQGDLQEYCNNKEQPKCPFILEWINYGINILTIVKMNGQTQKNDKKLIEEYLLYDFTNTKFKNQEILSIILFTDKYTGQLMPCEVMKE